MNKIRRKALREIRDQIEALKDRLDNLGEEEAEYLDNIPENLWGSERYEKADAACDLLGDAFSSLEEAISSIEEAIE